MNILLEIDEVYIDDESSKREILRCINENVRHLKQCINETTKIKSKILALTTEHVQNLKLANEVATTVVMHNY